MALCIWAIAKAVIAHVYPEPSQVPVFVYGDDIVLPSKIAQAVTTALGMAGLMVNQSKSFVRGPFRESCGGEFVNTFDITPIRLRQMPTDDDESMFKTIAFVNSFTKKFGCYESEPLRQLVTQWYGPIPERDGSHTWTAEGVVHDSKHAGVFDIYDRQFDNSDLGVKTKKKYGVLFHRLLMPVARRVKYPKDNWSCLFRSLVRPSKTELGLTALPKRCSFKYRWVRLGV
jgi:hypothetical protein